MPQLLERFETLETEILAKLKEITIFHYIDLEGLDSLHDSAREAMTYAIQERVLSAALTPVEIQRITQMATRLEVIQAILDDFKNHDPTSPKDEQ